MSRDEDRPRQTSNGLDDIIRHILTSFGPADDITQDPTREELELEKLGLELDQLQQDIQERKKNADRIFVLISIWLATTLIIVLCQGDTNNDFSLSSGV